MSAPDELTFLRFIAAYPNDRTDLASEIRLDRAAPRDDAGLHDYLKLRLDDHFLISRLWQAYRRALRKARAPAGFPGRKGARR